MWRSTVKEKHISDDEFVLSENHVHSQQNNFLVAFRKSPENSSWEWYSHSGCYMAALTTGQEQEHCFTTSAHLPFTFAF